ncbi:MAG: hypothetical protein ACLVL7_14250 [Anaerotruncus massiliensis (ex Togo et al. 2019)]
MQDTYKKPLAFVMEATPPEEEDDLQDYALRSRPTARKSKL